MMAAIKKLIVWIVLFGGTVHGRVPENLVGTTIFPEFVRIALPIKKASGSRAGGAAEVKPVQEDKFYDLPLGALNLVSGAEFFTCVLQPLYQHGEYVELVEVVDDKKPLARADVESDFAGGSAGGGAEEEKHPVEAEAGVAAVTAGPKFKHCFYKNGFTKEQLEYEDCNPLVVLVRSLFWQLPGTEGLSDFRVTTLALVKDKKTKNIDLKATIEQWADVIAAVLATYPLHVQAEQADAASAAQRVAFTGINLINTVTHKNPSMKTAIEAFNSNLNRKNLGELIWDCIEYSKKNDLGEDFPLRILMGALYSLVGDDTTLISHFYKTLLNILDNPGKAFAPLAPLKDKRAEFGLSDDSEVQVTSNEHSAIAMINSLIGVFTPVSYGLAKVFGQQFPDCLETTIRNIVCALLAQDDGSFRAGLVRDDVQKFLNKFPTKKEQFLPQSHDDWAAIMSNVRKADGTPRFLYGLVTSGGEEYNLRGCCINMLTALNYIFELGIPDFDSHVISIDVEAGAANKAFIQRVIPLINEKLKEKLGDETKEVITLEDIQSQTADTTNKERIICRIEAALYAFRVQTTTTHGEVFVDSQENLAWVKGVSCCEYLKAALLKKPAYKKDVRFNIALMTASLFVGDLHGVLFAIKDNSALKKMLLAKISQVYAIEAVQGLAMLERCVSYGVFIDIALEAAKAGFLHGGYSVKSTSLQLFAKLTAQVSWAASLPEDILVAIFNYSQSLSILHSFVELVKSGRGTADALKVAKAAVKSINPFAYLQSLLLFSELVKKDCGFEDALEVAKASVKRGRFGSIYPAVHLFLEFVKRDLLLEEAVVAAKEGMRIDYADWRETSLDLFSALVQKGYGVEDALKAAKFGMETLHYSVQRKALALFSALVQRGHGLKEAQEAAEAGVKDGDCGVQWEAFFLFTALVERNCGLKEAQEAAEAGVKDSNAIVQEAALELSKAIQSRSAIATSIQKVVRGVQARELKDKKEAALKAAQRGSRRLVMDKTSGRVVIDEAKGSAPGDFELGFYRNKTRVKPAKGSAAQTSKKTRVAGLSLDDGSMVNEGRLNDFRRHVDELEGIRKDIARLLQEIRELDKNNPSAVEHEGAAAGLGGDLARRVTEIQLLATIREKLAQSLAEVKARASSKEPIAGISVRDRIRGIEAPRRSVAAAAAHGSVGTRSRRAVVFGGGRAATTSEGPARAGSGAGLDQDRMGSSRVAESTGRPLSPERSVEEDAGTGGVSASVAVELPADVKTIVDAIMAYAQDFKKAQYPGGVWGKVLDGKKNKNIMNAVTRVHANPESKKILRDAVEPLGLDLGKKLVAPDRVTSDSRSMYLKIREIFTAAE
jgi:hypothetical protein